jgi:hypothetical protein
MENKETIEEAAKEYAENEIKDRGTDNDKLICSIDFIAGAKWQSQKMYTEEDMIEFGKFCYNDAHSVYKITTFKELFEKFKNK